MKDKKRKSARIALSLVLLSVLLIGMLPATALAATIVLPPGSTSADLQTAINGASFGDVILISSDMTFLGTVSIRTGLEVTIRSDITDNWAMQQTIPGTRHFVIDGSLILENITLDGLNNSGGVQLNRGAFAMLDGSVIQNCFATNGGGVGVIAGVFSIYGGELKNNTAVNGGGAYLGAGLFNMSASNGVISGNKAENGGGVYINSGTYRLTGGDISNNEAQNGGGLYLNGGALSMTIGNFNYNSASNNGGGVYVSSAASLDITGSSSISYNSAVGDGGGIYTESTSYANLTTGNSLAFRNNTASAAYTPPTNASTLYPAIKFSRTTIANHPLNNYDINYHGEPILYYVYYNANGGTGSYTGPGISPGKTDTVLSWEEAGISYEGHTFVKWNTRMNGSGTNYSPGNEITLTGNVTLFAQWSLNDYIVTFNSNGGTPVSSQTVAHGNKVTEPEPPTKTGHVFAGWYTDDGTFANEWVCDTNVVTESTTLYAKWDLDEYTVTFNCNGGTPVSSQTVAYGNKIAEPTPPTKTGHAFAGWYTDDGTFANEWVCDTDVVTENITLYAKWDVDEYTVTFNSNGGTPVSSQTVAPGNKATEPAPPTRTDYIFMGWYTDNGSFENMWDFNTDIVTEDITLHAKWISKDCKKYTVTFNSNGGTLVSSQVVFYNEKATEPKDPTKAGYTFAGWYIDGGTFEDEWYFSYYTVTENITLYAKWIPNECERYTVTFDSNGGTLVNRQTVFYGEKATEPKDPKKNGYTFAGWYTDNGAFKHEWNFYTEIVTKDVILYAKWIPNACEKCTVTFRSNGGTPVRKQIVICGEKAMKPKDPTKNGYTFDGWYTDSKFEHKWNFNRDVVHEDINLYAKWKANEYTIRFDSNGGTSVKNQTVCYGDKVQEPAQPTKKGYRFVGWYDDNGMFKHEWHFDTDVVKENITLYAKWIPDKGDEFIVVFDSNGGTSVSTQTVSDGEKAAKPKDPTKAGYTFAGWYDDNGTFKHEWHFDTDVVKKDITLYAKWTPTEEDKYIVIFDSNGGTSVSSQTVSDGEKAAKPKDPTKAGYTFAGWYDDNGTFSHEWHFDTDVVKEDITLYAKWTPNEEDKCIVIFDSNGGTSVNSQTVSDGEKAAKPKDPTKAGYTFAGWYDDNGTFSHEWHFDTDFVSQDIILYAKWLKNPDPVKPSDPSQPSKPSHPKTGDHYISLWTLCTGLIATGCLFCFVIKKKRADIKKRIQTF